MKQRRFGWLLAALSGLLLATVAVLAPSASHTQAQSPLVIGGRAANFGVQSLTGGFLPDPAQYSVVSGGSLHGSVAGSACRGYVTGQPDIILHYSNAASFVRFFVRGQGDTTLIINDAAGRWHCDDDSGGSLNPMVDINNPPSGQYDVWIGSYQAGTNIRGTLGVTELRNVRP